MSVRLSLTVAVTTLALVSISLPVVAADDAEGGGTQATTLLDLSGLAALGPGQVLAVHDAKNPDEDDRPRASVLTLSGTPQGVLWEPITIEWPSDEGPANDLESAAGIPGSSSVLLAESGDDESAFQRLFVVEIDASGDTPTGSISDVVEWQPSVFNVESSAVAAVGDQLVLLFAERAQGETTTDIQWAPLTLHPLAIGEPAAASFTSPAVQGSEDRPVSAMEVGPDGTIYIASAFDSGNDDGPFSSSVWIAGTVEAGADGPTVVIDAEPLLITYVDGFKVESLALIEGDDGGSHLYLGTDDEDYGGVLRPIPGQ